MDIKVEIQSYLSNKREIVEKALQDLVPKPAGVFRKHFESMHYSLFVGGKRIRPVLCLAAGDAVNGAKQVEKRLLPVACALECIHTYSLIHDDLPAMTPCDGANRQITSSLAKRKPFSLETAC